MLNTILLIPVCSQNIPRRVVCRLPEIGTDRSGISGREKNKASGKVSGDVVF